MTVAELRFLETVPNRLRDIEVQLEKLNETMVEITKVLAERK